MKFRVEIRADAYAEVEVEAAQKGTAK